MGWTDKLKNNKDETKGAAKEQLGTATEDEHMEREGQIDETKSNLNRLARRSGRPKQGLGVRSCCLYADSGASHRDCGSSITMAPAIPRTGLVTGSSSARGLRQTALDLGVDTKVVQRSGHDRDSNRRHPRTILRRRTKVAPLAHRDHADRQPDHDQQPQKPSHVLQITQTE